MARWCATIAGGLRRTAAARVRDHRRPAAYRSGYRPSQWSSRSRSYAPRPARWGTRTSYGSRPSYRSSYSPWSRPSYRQPGQRYGWGQPGLTSGWYRSGQYPGRYWRFGQGQRYPGMTSQWGSPQWGWDRWGRWRRRYPYGRYGTGGSAYAQPSLRRAGRAALRGAADAAARDHGRAAAPRRRWRSRPQSRRRPSRTPPHRAPPAQGQAKSEEFFIEPEAFEFEPELDPSYENGRGEFESGIGASCPAGQARCPTRRSTRTR